MITNDEVVNQIEQKCKEINRIEDELTELDNTLFKNVQNLNSVDEINYDGPSWGTVIACFLFGWIFGD